MSDAADDLERRARRYVEDVLTLADVDAVEELFAHPSELEDVQAKDGQALETYADLKAYLTRALSGVEGHTVTVDEAVADGDAAMVRWELEGRLTDDLFGIPPTGKTVETDGVTSFRFDDDGRIVELHDHTDMQSFMPEVARVARRGMVEEMGDGVVVIDADGRIVDVNATVLETFDCERSELLDRAVGTLVDGGAPEAGETALITGPDGHRYFEVDASALSDPGGDRLGRMLVLHEVTERRRRVQQLGVLNRVLRHNLRNDLTVVKGVLDDVDEAAVDDPSLVEMAREKAADLLATAETARSVRDTIETTTTRPRDLATTVRTLADRAAEAYPTATLEVTAPASVRVATTAVVEDALWELIENACQHAGPTPRVAVDVAVRDGVAVLTVADDGPGLPDHERQVLEHGHEEDLAHGSGLGLWLVYWAFDASGADVVFEVDDGTTARATFPLAGGD